MLHRCQGAQETEAPSITLAACNRTDSEGEGVGEGRGGGRGNGAGLSMKCEGFSASRNPGGRAAGGLKLI